VDWKAWARVRRMLSPVGSGTFVARVDVGDNAFVVLPLVKMDGRALWLIGEGKVLGRLPLGSESLTLQRATRIAQADAMNGHRRNKVRASTTLCYCEVQGRTLLRAKVCKRA
jgi:hypothetical protein